MRFLQRIAWATAFVAAILILTSTTIVFACTASGGGVNCNTDSCTGEGQFGCCCDNAQGAACRCCDAGETCVCGTATDGSPLYLTQP